MQTLANIGYLQTRAANKTLFVVIDEVSQYIFQDEGRMLKLQALASELKERMQGKVWLLATGQQKLDDQNDSNVAFDLLVQGPGGAYALDMGSGYGTVLDGYARVSASGSTGGDLQVRFETDVIGGISWRDRGPMSAGQAESDLARDFVFAEASAGASYLDVVIEGLPPGSYLFEAVLHEAGSGGEAEPVEVRVDTSEGFGEGVTVPMSMGNNPATLGVASIEVDAMGDVVMRIQNLEAGRPHLISGLRIVPMP